MMELALGSLMRLSDMFLQPFLKHLELNDVCIKG